MVVVTLHEYLVNWRGRKTQRLIDGSPVAGTEFGLPLVEELSVANPRMAFSHDFDAEEVAWIREQLAGLRGKPASNTFLLDDLPLDWRYTIPALTP